MYDFESDDESEYVKINQRKRRRVKKRYSDPIGGIFKTQKQRMRGNGSKSKFPHSQSVSHLSPSQFRMNSRRYKSEKVSSMFSLQLKGESNAHLDEIFYSLDGMMKNKNETFLIKGSIHLLGLCQKGNVQFQLKTHGLASKLIESTFHLISLQYLKSPLLLGRYCLFYSICVLIISGMNISEGVMSQVIFQLYQIVTESCHSRPTLPSPETRKENSQSK